MPDNKEYSPQPSEHQETNEERYDQQRIGATVLSRANFQDRHKPAVESSLIRAKKSKEKLPNNGKEARNFSYLTRLARLVEKYGNQAEKRLWQASIKDDLLVQYDDIPESYWDAKKQELRDNGYGDIRMTEGYKREIYEAERELQKKSLEKWANYLGDESAPYPLWFKIYAWDGMTKMGVYDMDKKKYGTRNKTTVAPYPNPDGEILSGVLDVVNLYYGNNEKQLYTKEGERNIKLEQLVQSGNFPKIFNAIQQDIAPIVMPPENTEDVHGEWIEYRPGEEDDIARAARGTKWCIASSSVGRYYLEHGTYGNYDDDDEYDNEDDDYGYDDDDDEYDNEDDDYGNDDDEYDNEDDDDDIKNKKLKSRFILFHLKDPSTGKLSRNAVASIRLNLDGDVAEISGLKEGQALNDSLVPIVEEKVKSLPGGEDFLPKFADKNKLIALDRKMEKSEDLTKEELEFLYEIHRPIQTLDTYNSYDPRVNELKRKYGIAYALDAGLSVNQLVSRLGACAIARNLDTLISHGANININQLVSRLDSDDIADNLGTLLSHGADINQLVSDLKNDDIANNLDTLISHGADINQLVSRLDSDDIVDNLGTLLSHGVDINQLVSELSPYYIVKNLDTLISHGANIDINHPVSELHPYDIARNLGTLISHGANIDINHLVSELHPYDIANNLDALLSHGADINQLVSKLDSSDITENLDTLLSHGANINQLVSKLHRYAIARNLDTLISHGANINQLVSRLDSSDIVKNLDTLLSHGANANQLVSELNNQYYIADNLDTLISHGANININQLVSRLGDHAIARNLDALISYGANININQLVSRLGDHDIANNLDTLLSHGADINQLVSKLHRLDIVKNLDTLLSHGADINQLVSKLHRYDIADNLDTLLSHGADINQLVSRLDSSDIARNKNILRRHGADV